MKKSPLTQQQLMVMVFGVAFSLLLTACKSDNIQALAGPGTGGTGPFTTSSYETIVARGPSVTPPSIYPDYNEHHINSKDPDILKPNNGSTSILPLPKPQPDADNTNNDKNQQLLVRVLPSSVITQQCQGIQRQLSLLAEPITDKPANTKEPKESKKSNKSKVTQSVDVDNKQLTPVISTESDHPKTTDSLLIAKNTPVPILAIVSNDSSQKIFEQQHNCQAFSINDSQGQSLTVPTKDCTSPTTTIQYVAKQSHQYYAGVDIPTNPAKYRITFTNTIEGMDAGQCPPLYLDIEVSTVISPTS